MTNLSFGNSDSKRERKEIPPKKGESEPPYIKSAKWADAKGNEIQCLLYGVDEVYVRVELLKKCNGKTIEIKYLEYDTFLTSTTIKKINMNTQ